MKLKTVVKLYELFLFSGVVLILVGVFLLDNLTVTFIGAGLGSIAAIVISPLCKCPKCGRYLSLKFSLPRNCPYCGENLEQYMEEEQIILRRSIKWM